MLTETERNELHERLQAIQREEERQAAEAASRREIALDHPGGQLIDLRGAPLRMR